jgi:hypothetical protein
MAEMFASWHPAWRANEPESLKLAAIRIVAFAIVPVVAIWGPLVVAAAAFGSGQPQTATVSNCEDYALRYYGVGVDRVEVECAALDLPGRWWVAECGSGAGGTWIALVTEWDYGESRSALRSGLPWNVRGMKLFTRDLASAPEARSRMYEDFLKFLEHQLGEPSESAAYQHAQASARAVSALGLDCVLRSSTAEYIERAGREGEIFVETIRGIGCVLHRKEYPGGYFYLEWLVMVAPGVTGPSGADLEEELFEIVEWLELGPVER